MKHLAVLAAAILLATPALAQTRARPAKPAPPPVNLKDATIHAWIKARLDGSGFTYVDHGEDSAYYLAPARNQAAEPRRYIWVRRERFAADADGVRSAMTLYEFDCAENRHRILARDTFGGLNLTEPMDSHDADIDDEKQSRWTYVRDASLGETLLFGACALKDPAFDPAPAP